MRSKYLKHLLICVSVKQGAFISPHRIFQQRKCYLVQISYWYYRYCLFTMVFLLSHFEHFVIYFWLSAVMYLAFLIHRYTNSPLRKTGIPGPFLGQFSSMYRAYHVLRRDWHRKLNRLHAVYGPVVWIAPTEVSISDPKYRDIIYSFASKNPNTFFKKSKRFETGQFNQDFSFIFEQDPPSARMGKYAMAHMYSEANLKDFERNFDNVSISHYSSYQN